MSSSTCGRSAPLRGGTLVKHWTNAVSLHLLSSRHWLASGHHNCCGGWSILCACWTLGQTSSGLWLCCCSILHCFTISRVLNGDFSSFCCWACCEGWWSSVRIGPLSASRRVFCGGPSCWISLCAFCGYALCGTLLPQCLHVEKPSLQQLEALLPEVEGATAAAGSFATRVGGNRVLGLTAAAQALSGVLLPVCADYTENPYERAPYNWVAGAAWS